MNTSNDREHETTAHSLSAERTAHLLQKAETKIGNIAHRTTRSILSKILLSDPDHTGALALLKQVSRDQNAALTLRFMASDLVREFQTSHDESLLRLSFRLAEKALDNDPNEENDRNYHLFAKITRNQHNAESFVHYLDKALKHNPKHIASLDIRDTIISRMGDAKLGAEAFDLLGMDKDNHENSFKALSFQFEMRAKDDKNPDAFSALKETVLLCAQGPQKSPANPPEAKDYILPRQAPLTREWQFKNALETKLSEFLEHSIPDIG